MATFQSTAISNKRPVAVHGLRRNVQVARASVAVTTALVTTDAIQFFYMPLNAVIVGGYIKSDDLDSNGSPAITINVGDAGSATRLFSASTVCQAGTASAVTVVGALGYQFTAKTLIVAALQANAATAVAGNIELCLYYFVDDSATS